MKPENILNNLIKQSNNKDRKYERVYRLLYNEELYLVAYQNIYSNNGSTTNGIDGKNIDGMSIKKIKNLIKSLKDESYKPCPVKRVYIPKKDNKLRPLGIPTFEDKLVQEVIRILLNAIYDGYFENTSHGFRNNKSCHTALIQIQKSFTGVKWFIEGDIKSFFDNIDHNILIEIMKERINDDRFLRLIRKFLNAGYIKDWKFHKTYSGTPQGGIISPILANIYLDKFDKYVQEYIENFNKGKRRKRNNEYRKIETKLAKNRKDLNNAENEKKIIIEEIKNLEKIRRYIPYGDAMDQNFKRLTYVRYADDWLCGVIGSKEDCEKIKNDFKHFLYDKLHLELSDEKTLITNAKKKARFLGFDIYIRKSNLQKRNKNGVLIRNYTDRVVLEIPMSIIERKLLDLKAMEIIFHNGKKVWKYKAIYRLKDSDDLEILEFYNSRIRGLYNYYSIANNSSIINSYKYILQYSMYKTYATKYRTSKVKIIKKYRINKDFGIKYKNSKGNEKIMLFYNKGFKRKKESLKYDIDRIKDNQFYLGRTSLMDRLQSNICEVCGKEDVELEMHHVHKLKDLKGKKFWERLMIARNRKTLAVCKNCHTKIHYGKLD